MRNRGDVRNRENLDPERIERAHRRFTSRSGSLDQHLEILDPAFLRAAAGRPEPDSRQMLDELRTELKRLRDLLD